MFHRILTCHTDIPPTSDRNVQVKVELNPQGDLYLNYEVTGDIEKICVPAPQTPAAVDGLWEHLCFEAFIAVKGDASYQEFNFSPSGQWAAYAFSEYRIRKDGRVSQSPVIRFAQSDRLLQLEAVVAAADLPVGEPLELGLTAVIEEIDGSHTYWALYHPEAHPDFHHRAGFILSLNRT